MLIHIAIKEFREHLLSARFALTMGVLLLLVTATVLALSADYRKQVDDYNRRVELHRRGLAVYALGRPAMVDRPVPVLSSLFRGLSFTIPESIELSTANPPNPAQQPDLEATESIFPKIDLSFCFGVVLSLIALLFSYDIVTAEKEQGTLKQMLANAAPRAVILFSKWLAVFATLAVMAIITLGYAIILAALLTDSRFTLHGSDWAALGMILLTSLLYLSAFLLLGTFVSSLVTRSAASLAILMLVWVLAVFVFPNASPYLAVWLSPAPTYQQAQREERQLTARLTAELKKRHEQGAQKVRDEKLGRVEMNRIYNEIQNTWESEQKSALMGPENQYLSALQRQERTGVRLASLSPYGCAVYAFNLLADSGAEASDRFEQLARLFDRDQLASYARAAQMLPRDQAPSPPAFTYQPTPLGQRLRASELQLSILLLYNAALFVASYAAFRRYDVR